MAELVIEKQGSIGIIIFSNVERMNAMTLGMWQALPKAIEGFDRDPEVRVIILQGAGTKAFVSGADISEFEHLRNAKEVQARYDDAVNMALAAPGDCTKPVIAKIRGICIGGGLGLAAACDLRICSEASIFRMPAARLGLGYEAQGVKKFVDILGMANAMEIFLTARKFDAVDALRMGFVSRVCKEDQLDGVVSEFADMIGENAPLTVKASKYSIKQMVLPPNEQDMAGAEKMVADCFASEDFKEGRRAFMEKRLPRFQGR